MSDIVFASVGPDFDKVFPQPGPVRNILSKFMDSAGRAALLEARKRSFSPFLTGCLVANLQWDYEPGLLVGGIGIDLDVVPYALKQEFEHSTKADFLLRAAQLANDIIDSQFRTFDKLGVLFTSKSVAVAVARALSVVKTISVDPDPDPSACRKRKTVEGQGGAGRRLIERLGR